MTPTTLDKTTKPVVPSLEDIQLAKESTKQIAELNAEGTEHVAKVVIDDKRLEIKLSKSMFLALTGQR